MSKPSSALTQYERVSKSDLKANRHVKLSPPQSQEDPECVALDRAASEEAAREVQVSPDVKPVPTTAQEVSRCGCRTKKLMTCTITVLAVAGIVASAVGTQKLRKDANDPSQLSSGDLNSPSPASLRVSRVLPGDASVQAYPDCHVDYPEDIGDGHCDSGEYNTEECGWDGGDCLPVEGFPSCHVGRPTWIGNSRCNGGDYNTEECGWDGGDCVIERYPDCHVDGPKLTGDDECYGGEYNTEKCGWDGGDCVEFNELYPDCHVERPEWIGDGGCDGRESNTEECGWDGGDCVEFNELYPDCQVRNVGYPGDIGDGECDGDYNNEECEWDGGDCVELYELYPDCHVHYTDEIGNGYCMLGEYNTEECGWDGGDCAEFNELYPNCHVNSPNWIGDGVMEAHTTRRSAGTTGGIAERKPANQGGSAVVSILGTVSIQSTVGGRSSSNPCKQLA